MNDLSPITTAEIDRLFAVMPGDAATRILSFADALAVFAQARDKKSAAAAMAARLEPLGYKGLSLKSLYRKLDDFRNEGLWSLVPGKYRRENVRGIVANEAFVEHWQTLVLENRRKMRPAWRRLVCDFCAGVEIPGVGTWRDVYLQMRGFMPSAGEPCPWSERNPPPGWSFRNLLKFKPSEFAMVAAHHGMAEAKSRFGITVSKTRVGLSCCQVVEFDDMWYEHSVMFPGNREPQRVVEFAAIDVLTGHVVCYLPKPIRERADGTRETLRAAWAKYVYHYVLCVSGLPPERVVFVGERGTTKADGEFEAALKLVNAWREAQGNGPVEWRTGALANAPLAKGLHDGAAKGNPRNKPHIEQMHATLKNSIGHIIGEIGGGRGVQPEETGAMVAEAKRLAAIALAANLPVEKVKTPFLSWPVYSEAIERAHRQMDERADHSLEGWEDCGFVKGEFRLKAEASWRAVKAMADMSPEEAGAVTALVKAGMAEYREVRLSPREAWEKSKYVLKAVPEYLAPLILGSELCCVAKVTGNMQFVYKDPNVGSRLTVAAIAGGRLLSRGATYRVWVNPLDGGKAYVCDMQGQYLGVAKVLQAVRADATPEDLAAQLGLRQRVLSDEARRLAPIARRRLAAANERAAANLAAFGLEDPVASGVDPSASGDGYSLAELAGAVTNEEPAQPVEKSFSLAELSSV
ncbi:MAG: hypothetical protein IKO72_09015 [Kiritimatiellae bacterium]|nr:hypothetical protein [Kiritimatiellia bacterium]